MNTQVVTETLLDVLLDFLLAASGPREEYRSCSSLRTLYSLRMVMSDGGRYLSHLLSLLKGAELPAHCRCPHGSAIAP